MTDKKIEKIAKDFKSGMQKIADESGCTISVSTPVEEEKVIAEPKKDLLTEVREIHKQLRAVGGYIVNKVKYERKSGQVEISYDQIIGDGRDDVKVVLKSNDKPKPEFIEAMDALAPWVERICQLQEGYCSEAEIRGVSISYSHDVMGACITCLIPLYRANSPLCLNTPFLPSDQYNEGGEAPTLPSGCTKIINDLIEYAENYIDGDRVIEEDNQLKLDLDAQ